MQRQFNKRLGELDAIYQSALDEINWTLIQLENKRLKKAIQAIEYPHSLNNILFYINEEVANMLAGSSRPLLKEWGIRCQIFYKQGVLNIHVEPKTGVLVAKRGGISVFHGGFWSKFDGQGVWDISKECWVPSSNSKGERIFHDALYRGCPNGSFHMTAPIKPADLSKYPEFPIELISPMHVAALIGDTELMYQLMLKGAVVNDNHNKWRVTPLELAIISEHENVIDFILQHGVSTNTALKLAAEKGSFRIIEKIVGMNAPITDDILNAALKRDKKFHVYLNHRRMKDIEDQLEHHEGDAFNVLKEILNYPVIPVQSLVDLIRKESEIISKIENEADGNTLLHQLVIGKEIVKVKALLQAIEQACYDGFEFSFDKEKKNKAGKSILDLALEKANENKELAVCILMHNPKISLEQQKLIMSAKIDIPEIRRAKEDKTNNTLSGQNQRINVHQNILEKTNRELMTAVKEIDCLHRVNVKQYQKLKDQQRELDSTKQELKKIQQEVADLRNVNAQQTQASKVQQDVLGVTIQELITTKEQVNQLNNQVQIHQIMLVQMLQVLNNGPTPMDRDTIFALPQENISNAIHIAELNIEPVNLNQQMWNQPSSSYETKNTNRMFVPYQGVPDEQNVSRLKMTNEIVNYTGNLK